MNMRNLLIIGFALGLCACSHSATSATNAPSAPSTARSRVAAGYSQTASASQISSATITARTTAPVVLLETSGTDSAADRDCLALDAAFDNVAQQSIAKHEATTLPAGVSLHLDPRDAVIDDGIVGNRTPANYVNVITDDGHRGAVCRGQTAYLAAITH